MPATKTEQTPDQTPRTMRQMSAWWAMAFATGAVLFGLTASRTIQWQDYGHFTLRIVEGELFNELGLALAHPLHFWLSRLAIGVLPIEPAHAVALVSALAGALTIANVFGCVLSITRRIDAALLAALSLALANTFWRMSTMPECYTVTTALLSAELWCLALYFRAAHADARPRWLVAAFFFNGLGLTNHNLALLTGTILGIVLLHALLTRRVCWWRALLAAGAWALGAAPYLALVVIEAVSTGDVPAAVRSALFGNHYAEDVMNASPSLKLAAISAAFTVLSFFNLTLVFAAAGLWRVVRDPAGRGLWLALAGALLIHLLFVLRYNVVDQHTFLLPAYTLIAVLAGAGYAAITAGWTPANTRRLFAASLVLVLLAPAVYLAAAALARSSDALGDFARNKPYRDDYRYLFVPWGACETTAAQMADHALRLAGDDGLVLLGDTMARFAVIYTAQERGLEGVEVRYGRDILETDWAELANRRVVLVPASTDDPPIDLPRGMRWRADGPLYVLESKPDADPRATPLPGGGTP